MKPAWAEPLWTEPGGETLGNHSGDFGSGENIALTRIIVVNCNEMLLSIIIVGYFRMVNSYLRMVNR